MDLLFRAEPYRQSCDATVIAVADRGVRLDRTVFYPTGGGQPGDTGWLHFDGRAVRVVDTVKGDGPEDVIHVIEPDADGPGAGTTVTAEIDWDRRYRHMRMHTCMHLLCAVVPGAVTGGQIGADRSRLDFNVPASTLDKDTLTLALNDLVARDVRVSPRWISDNDLAAQPELVRTMSVQPPSGAGKVRLLEIDGIDLQPCGGTHVARTGEIGKVQVVKIENKGRQNRRIVVAFID